MFKKANLPLLATAALAASPSAFATINLLKEGDLSFSTSGFVETDVTVDSTRSFNEVTGNNPVARGDSTNGNNGRASVSIRNSRLAFGADYKPQGQWSGRGYLEFDLLGFDPAPPGATGATNSEQGFLTSPTFRVRHAYLKAENDGWSVLTGQTWQLFGWQPYYFETTVDVLPIPGIPYSRTPQIRVGKSGFVGDQIRLEGAVAVNRPPQRDSGIPEVQGGIRLAYDGWRGVATNGSNGRPDAQPLSLGVSGLFREIKIPAVGGGLADQTDYPATALSVNLFAPILPATSEATQNSLALIGGWTTGQGYGDEFNGWTGGTSGNLSGTSFNGRTEPNLDGGIGDYDGTGSFQLIQLTSLHLDLQYVLPMHATTWIDVGYGRLTSNNMFQLVNATNKASGGNIPYVKDQAAYANIFHDCTSHIRIGAEFLRIRTDYADTTVAFNNRYQFSTFFLF